MLSGFPLNFTPGTPKNPFSFFHCQGYLYLEFLFYYIYFCVYYLSSSLGSFLNTEGFARHHKASALQLLADIKTVPMQSPRWCQLVCLHRINSNTNIWSFNLNVPNHLQQPFVWHFFPKTYCDTKRVSPRISFWLIKMLGNYVCNMSPKNSWKNVTFWTLL